MTIVLFHIILIYHSNCNLNTEKSKCLSNCPKLYFEFTSFFPKIKIKLIWSTIMTGWRNCLAKQNYIRLEICYDFGLSRLSTLSKLWIGLSESDKENKFELHIFLRSSFIWWENILLSFAADYVEIDTGITADFTNSKFLLTSECHKNIPFPQSSILLLLL